MKHSIHLFIVLTLFLHIISTEHLLAQTNNTTKQREWRDIQKMADKAFALKYQEANLKNNELKNKVRARMRSFQETIYALTTWIDKYFPDGDEHPTTPYVHSIFLQTLYLEYAGHYQHAYKAYSNYLPELLYQLEMTHQTIPIYDKMPISHWILSRSTALAIVNKELTARADQFEISILQSADDEITKALRRVDYLLKTDQYGSIVSSQSDRQFVMKQMILHVADSTAETDQVKWSDIYIKGICKNFEQPFLKKTFTNFDFYNINGCAEVDQKITLALNEVAENIANNYIKGRPLEHVVFVTHGASLTDTIFNRLFGENDSFDSINPNFKRWNGKVIFVNTSLCDENDSMISKIQDQAAFSWLLNDWSGIMPPHWFIGAAYNNKVAENSRPDTYRLFFLKSTLEHNKFPKIESFINMKYNSTTSEVIFIKGYWEYFWWFLEKKAITSELYNSIRNIKQPESETIENEWVKLLTTVTQESMEELNIEFVKFIQSRKIENIPQADHHWELVAKDFILSDNDDH